MKTARVTGRISVLAICLLTAVGWSSGAPYGMSDGSFGDVLAGSILMINLIPGLVAALLVRLLDVAGAAEFVAVGVAWAFLSALQWELVARFIARRRSRFLYQSAPE